MRSFTLAVIRMSTTATYKSGFPFHISHKFHNLFAKLRYDGDIELSTRNDFRNAFSHSISNGSDRFTAEAFTEVGKIIGLVLNNPENKAKQKEAADKVATLCAKYPLYPNF